MENSDLAIRLEKIEKREKWLFLLIGILVGFLLFMVMGFDTFDPEVKKVSLEAKKIELDVNIKEIPNQIMFMGK